MDDVDAPSSGRGTTSARRDFGSSARLWGGFFGRAWLWFVAGCLVVTFVPMLFGWRPYVVESGSMQPRIKVGDVILSSPEHDAKKLLGHVTVFTDPDASRAGTVKSHRVVKINSDGTLVTKGDANPTVDPTPVPMSDVKGIGRLLVRWVGLPLIWVQNGAWLKLALLVLTLWVAAVLVVRDHDEPAADNDDETDPGDDDDGLDDDVDGAVWVATPRHRASSVSRSTGWRVGAMANASRPARHRRTRRPIERSRLRGSRSRMLRLSAVVIGLAALLLPTTDAAFSATSLSTGPTWSTASDFSTGSCAAAWKATTVYQNGDTVSYGGQQGQARYYTVGNTPGASGSTVWRQLGYCPSPPPGVCPAMPWNVNVAYDGGDVVAYLGSKWEANWYIQGEAPSQTPYGPWQYLGVCTG